jgi:hypothetical protein
MLHHQNIDSVQDLSHYGSATHQQVLSSNWHIVGPMLLKGTDVWTGAQSRCYSSFQADNAG